MNNLKLNFFIILAILIINSRAFGSQLSDNIEINIADVVRVEGENKVVIKLKNIDKKQLSIQITHLHLLLNDA